jgi:hypothetical protein
MSLTLAFSIQNKQLSVCRRRTERQGIPTATKFPGASAGHSERAFCSCVTKVTEVIFLHLPPNITQSSDDV